MIRVLISFYVAVAVMSVLKAHAQSPSTPIPVVPPTATVSLPPPTDPPTRTPTSQGPAFVQPVTDGANVRAQADISSERVGQMQTGESFIVIGRYFEWLQIEFPDAPSGVGWVHESVVTLQGDERLIRDYSQESLPTENPTIVSRRETAQAITATPGGILTLTAQAQVTPEGVFTMPPPSDLGSLGQEQPREEGNIAVPGADGPQANNNILPTYTYPAETPTPINISDLVSVPRARTEEGGIPPILPIGILLVAGSVGMLFVLLRS